MLDVRRTSLLVGFLLACGPAFAQVDSSSVLVTDLLNIRQLDDVVVSPDGRQVVYTVRSMEPTEPGGDSLVYRTHLYLADGNATVPPRPLTYGSDSARDPAWNPDGDQIAFVRDVDGTPQIFVLPMFGGEAQQVTRIGSGASAPEWSPDGARVLFSSELTIDQLRERLDGNPSWPSERPGRTWSDADDVDPDPSGSLAEVRAWLEKNEDDGHARVLHRLNLHGEHELETEPRFRQFFVAPTDTLAEPVMITNGYHHFSSAEWLKDGERIIVAGSVQEDIHPDRVQDSDLFLAAADGDRLTPFLEMDGYAVYEPTLSPNGESLAFLARDEDDWGYAQTELALLTVANPDDASLLTEHFDRSVDQARWSQDGWSLYFTAASNGGVPLYRLEPFDVPVDTSDTTSVSGPDTAQEAVEVEGDTTAVNRDPAEGAAADQAVDLAEADRAAAGLAGEAAAAGIDTAGSDTAGSDSTAARQGTEALATAELTPDAPPDAIPIERLTSYNRGIYSFDIGRATVYYAAAEVANPSELYASNLPFTEQRRLTKHNADWLEGKQLSVPESRTLVRDTLEIQYWIMKPTTFDEGQTYPLLVAIHGGPGAMWGPGEATMWHEFQFFASKGYGIVFSNPRGSGGYGYDFVRANYQDWGAGPAADVLAAATAAAEEPWIDASRQVVTGGSYAGYLTAWILAHDDRFLAGVAQRGVYALDTFLGEGNAWRLVPSHFGGFPWETTSDSLRVSDAGFVESGMDIAESPAEVLRRNSPITFVDQIRTPLLIMHADRDLRTGVVQSEVLYKSLKLLGRPVEYVRYPRAGHDLSRTGEPKQRMDRILRIYEFMERFVR